MYSIITTFGCPYNCTYCISKKIGLERNSLFYKNTSWVDTVRYAIHDTFSISGGGDPFFRYDYHKSFWEFIDNIATELNCWYDVHTAIIDYPNRNNFKRLRKIILHLNPNTLDKVYEADRVVMVVDNTITIADMKRFESLYPNIQLAYRQIIKDLKPNLKVDLYAKTIKLRHPNSKYIKQKDYNTYIFPDGSIKTKFLD